MHTYILRLNCHDKEIIKQLLSYYSKKYIFGLEIGKETKKAHTHAVFLSSAQDSAIRMKIRSIVGAGNESYSLKKAKEEYPLEALAYVIKTGDYYHEGFTWEEMMDIESKNDEIVEKYKTQKKDKKNRQQMMTDAVREYLVKRKYDPNDYKYPPRTQRMRPDVSGDSKILIGPVMHDILVYKQGLEYSLEAIVDYYITNDLLLDNFRMVKETKTIFIKIYPQFIQLYKESLMALL